MTNCVMTHNVKVAKGLNATVPYLWDKQIQRNVMTSMTPFTQEQVKAESIASGRELAVKVLPVEKGPVVYLLAYDEYNFRYPDTLKYAKFFETPNHGMPRLLVPIDNKDSRLIMGRVEIAEDIELNAGQCDVVFTLKMGPLRGKEQSIRLLEISAHADLLAEYMRCSRTGEDYATLDLRYANIATSLAQAFVEMNQLRFVEIVSGGPEFQAKVEKPQGKDVVIEYPAPKD